MNGSYLRIALATTLLVAILPFDLKAEEFTEIDVTINVYKNSGTTKAKAQEAVKKANEILKKANIKLNVSDARTHDNKTTGDDDSGGVRRGMESSQGQNGTRFAPRATRR